MRWQDVDTTYIVFATHNHGLKWLFFCFVALRMKRDVSFMMMVSEALVWSDDTLYCLDLLDDELKETWAQVRKEEETAGTKGQTHFDFGVF